MAGSTDYRIGVVGSSGLPDRGRRPGVCPAGMRIRPATDADSTAMAGVVQQVLHEHGLPFDPFLLDADILTPEATYWAGGGALFVAVDSHDHLVGTAGLLRTAPGCGEVRKMFLLPAARGFGTGRALLNAVLDAACSRGLKRLTLTTRQRYHRAIRLYEQTGFRPVGPAGRLRGDDLGVTYELELPADPSHGLADVHRRAGLLGPYGVGANQRLDCES
jgi:GNAT superfamily N-acetyltransferase